MIQFINTCSSLHVLHVMHPSDGEERSDTHTHTHTQTHTLHHYHTNTHHPPLCSVIICLPNEWMFINTNEWLSNIWLYIVSSLVCTVYTTLEHCGRALWHTHTHSSSHTHTHTHTHNTHRLHHTTTTIPHHTTVHTTYHLLLDSIGI